jgi:hypothetical protein
VLHAGLVGGLTNAYKILVGNLQGRGNLVDLTIDKIILSIWMFNIWDTRM